MKKFVKFILAVAILTICIMVPFVSMADVKSGPEKPGFYNMDGETFYYVKKDGNLKKVKGWKTIEDRKYFFSRSSGKMLKGWQAIDGQKYYFKQSDAGGYMLTGVQAIGSYKYFFSKKNGHMSKGWQTVNGYKYYFSKDNGHMLKGWQTIDGHKYYFSKKNGHMLKGFQKINGATYYFGKSTGKRLIGWVKRGNSKCYFSKSTGKMLKGRHKVGKYTYYFGKKTGKRLKGWKTFNDHKYYFGGKHARMYKGIHKIGKNVYTFKENGQLKRVVYGDQKAICLTFDDGPSENTEIVLSALKKNEALATFFVLGEKAGKYKKQLNEAVDMGCQIGNHSRNHPQLSTLSESEIRGQMASCRSAIRKNAGISPKVCRSPYGELSSNIRSNVGYPIILWSIDTLDWKTRNSTATYHSVMKNAKDGAIVLMHDIHYPTAVAVKRIVPALNKKGYQMVTIEEMALLKGVKLKDGHVYTHF